MQGLITAAGLGTRSGLNGRLRKEMLPVYSLESGNLVLRPIIETIYNRMRSSGIDSVGVVLDPDDSRTIEYVRSFMSDTEIIFQKSKNGYGGAVLSAVDFISDDLFLLNAGDGMLLPPDSYARLGVPSSRDPVISVMKVDNPRRYGNASFEPHGSELVVTGLIEKPAVPISSYGMCASYILPRSIFSHFDPKLENIELTPAIGRIISGGTVVKAVEFSRNEWISVGVASEYVKILQRSLDATMNQ